MIRVKKNTAKRKTKENTHTKNMNTDYNSLANYYEAQGPVSQTFAPQTFAPQTFAFQAAVPQTTVPQIFKRQDLLLQPFAPQTYTPQTFAIVPQAIAPQAIVPQAIAPQAIAPQAIVPQAIAFQAIASQAIASQAIASQAIAPQAIVPQVIAPQTVSPQTSADQTLSYANQLSNSSNSSLTPVTSELKSIWTHTPPVGSTLLPVTISTPWYGAYREIKESPDMTETYARTRSFPQVRDLFHYVRTHFVQKQNAATHLPPSNLLKLLWEVPISVLYEASSPQKPQQQLEMSETLLREEQQRLIAQDSLNWNTNEFVPTMGQEIVYPNAFIQPQHELQHNWQHQQMSQSNNVQMPLPHTIHMSHAPRDDSSSQHVSTIYGIDPFFYYQKSNN